MAGALLLHRLRCLHLGHLLLLPTLELAHGAQVAVVALAAVRAALGLPEPSARLAMSGPMQHSSAGREACLCGSLGGGDPLCVPDRERLLRGTIVPRAVGTDRARLAKVGGFIRALIKPVKVEMHLHRLAAPPRRLGCRRRRSARRGAPACSVPTRDGLGQERARPLCCARVNLRLEGAGLHPMACAGKLVLGAGCGCERCQPRQTL
mmetsp:Transcript_4122/g.10927  ORF Transcript_4122/g.10927 Transcript_4122/m.10927 type:complete len:207 (+) Transcript_4122:1321-1941(+)